MTLDHDPYIVGYKISWLLLDMGGGYDWLYWLHTEVMFGYMQERSLSVTLIWVQGPPILCEQAVHACLEL